MIWSFEIQTLGRLLCAEPTSAHQALYGAGRDAIFQRNAAECATQCQRLLADEPLRRQIARRGHERARRNNHYNEPMLAAVIEPALRALEERQ